MATNRAASRTRGQIGSDKGIQLGDVLIIKNAGSPTDGPTGTGAGKANIGSVCLDTTNGKIYVQGGTKASPVWKLVTSA